MAVAVAVAVAVAMPMWPCGAVACGLTWVVIPTARGGCRVCALLYAHILIAHGF